MENNIKKNPVGFLFEDGALTFVRSSYNSLYSYINFSSIRENAFLNNIYYFDSFNISTTENDSKYVPAFAVPFDSSYYTEYRTEYINRDSPYLFISGLSPKYKGIKDSVYKSKDNSYQLFWSKMTIPEMSYFSSEVIEDFMKNPEKFKHFSFLNSGNEAKENLQKSLYQTRWKLGRYFMNYTTNNVIAVLKNGRNVRNSYPIGVTNKYSKIAITGFHYLSFGEEILITGVFEKPDRITSEFNLSDLLSTWDEVKGEYVYKNKFKILVNNSLFNKKELSTLARAIQKNYLDFFIEKGIEVIYTTSENINKNAYPRKELPKLDSAELKNLIREVFPNLMLESLKRQERIARENKDLGSIEDFIQEEAQAQPERITYEDFSTSSYSQSINSLEDILGPFNEEDISSEQVEELVEEFRGRRDQAEFLSEAIMGTSLNTESLLGTVDPVTNNFSLNNLAVSSQVNYIHYNELVLVDDSE